MWIFVLLAFIVTGATALWGIRQFTRIRHTPLFIMVPLFLAVFIPCSIVVLVPIDLMSASQASHPLFYLSERARFVIWRVIYWLAFALTWAILPVLQSYVESGYHEQSRKLVDSLKHNARYQLTILAVGIVGLFYFVISSGLSLMSIKSLVIALSHSYALVLAIWLLGHGLVNLPRNLWNEADPRALLNHRYRHAAKCADMFAESQSTYADVAAEVKALSPYKSGQFLEWIDELIDEVETGPAIRHSGSSRVTVDRSMITEDYLAALSTRLYKAKSRAIRHEADWQKLVKDCSVAEDILNAQGSLVFRFSKTSLPPKMAYWYYTKLHTLLVRLWAAILAVLAVALIWSEVTHGTVVSLVNLVISSARGMLQQLLSTVVLGFMCMSAFASLTRIRVFNVYALVHRSSDTSSMLFYAMYACRLTVPLSYNYLTLISSRDSVFEEFLGKSINLTPLGKYFNDLLPRLVLIPVLFTLFHVYDKVKDFLGFGLAFDDEDEQDGSIVEGREMVSRALTDPRSRYAVQNPHLVRNFQEEGSPSIDRYEDRASSSLLAQSYSRPVDQAPPILGNQESNAAAKVRSFFDTIGQKFQQGVDQLRERNAEWAPLSGNNNIV